MPTAPSDCYKLKYNQYQCPNLHHKVIKLFKKSPLFMVKLSLWVLNLPGIIGLVPQVSAASLGKISAPICITKLSNYPKGLPYSS